MQKSTENKSSFDREYTRTRLMMLGINLNPGETVDEYIQRCGYPFAVEYSSQGIREDN